MPKTTTAAPKDAKKKNKPHAVIACHEDVREVVRLGAVLRGMSMKRYMNEVVLPLIKADNRRFLASVAEQLNVPGLPGHQQ